MALYFCKITQGGGNTSTVTSIQIALANCLDALPKGEAAIQSCLDAHPQYREELQEFLRLAASMRFLGQNSKPSRKQQGAILKRLLREQVSDNGRTEYQSPGEQPSYAPLPDAGSA
jgi:hypothetical protein